MKDAITPAQLRAARGLVNWSREELANQAGTTERTVARIELEEGAARQSTLTAIRTALEAAGVIFIQENGEGPGVRLRRTDKEKPATA
ncbi:MAG: helix-turn-helix transcriptional regulator [Niveispirillum sp.]|nr:helix-turn-helix transcriptional regulator [Niveispirillum sp.]